MVKQLLIEEFVKRFVLKERRDRALFELTAKKKRGNFTDKLNHAWEEILDMRKLKSLPKAPDDYEYVKKELQLQDNDLCYVISNYDDIDDQIMRFETAFDKSYRRGLGTLIITTTADRLYLQTEEIGHQFSFTGRMTKI